MGRGATRGHTHCWEMEREREKEREAEDSGNEREGRATQGQRGTTRETDRKEEGT